ncbi:MAG: DUF4037 domain-containing protein, partial [Treponema sp.]|nr:DUF4037 domain-containing protein [Treponema sp.]
LAIAIGGSRATGKADDKSDYDIYVYIQNTLENNSRNDILSPYCSYMEIGNRYWETEDNCILKNGVFIDIVYRNFSAFVQTVADVVENGLCYNGYTTCMWHNIMTCKIVYDKNNDLAKIKERFSVPYPQKLKTNIIKRSMNLLSDSIVSYDRQIKKSINRQDMVNINNRISAFLDSYFEIIFAINEQMNSGEKHIMEICLEKCKILPKGFEKNIQALFYCIGNDVNKVNIIIEEMICELKNVVGGSDIV